MACTSHTKDLKKQAATEIAAAEKAFEKMAAEKGIDSAFWFYADTAAVIKRGNDSLIKGKEGILNFYSASYFKTARVTWSLRFRRHGLYIWPLQVDDYRQSWH